MNLQIFRYMYDAPEVIMYVFAIPIVLISLSIHEVSHGFAAYKLGDPTARNLGRLSLNPLKHLDPLGALCMVLFRFGWAKPVPINTRYFKKPKRDMALTAAAGPLSNLLLAFISLLIYMIIIRTTRNMVLNDNVAMFLAYLALFFQYSHFMNLSLCVFNLIPVPPLDGSRIINLFLPTKIYFGIMKYERYITIALFALIWFGAFSGFISNTIGFISNLMYKALMPFLNF